MSGIILINVSYLIFSVNKCFVCLITCTCEADFSSSCDLKELKRDSTVKETTPTARSITSMKRLNQRRDKIGPSNPHPTPLTVPHLGCGLFVSNFHV